MGRGRIAAVIGGLVLVGAVPAVLNAFKITNPWVVGAAALLAALALVAAGMWQERFKRLVQRRDEQRFKVVDGVLLRAGRVPTVRQVTDPLPLGVHPSAPARKADPDSGAVAGDRVPTYVPRDIDAELAERLRVGGFVVLVGDSTAGKSRAAFEAIRAELSSHELFVPGDKNIGRDVMAALVERTRQSRRAVLWLDDLEHYIRSGVITTAQISRIRDGKGHKMIVATLRSAEEDQLTQVAADAEDSKRRLGDEAIQILGQAHKIRLRRLFTPQEVERAHAQASDERIADALDYSSEYGLAEYLAAGPHLQDAYDNAWEVGRNPRGAALVAAAIDSRRAGHLSPFPRRCWKSCIRTISTPAADSGSDPKRWNRHGSGQSGSAAPPPHSFNQWATMERGWRFLTIWSTATSNRADLPPMFPITPSESSFAMLTHQTSIPSPTRCRPRDATQSPRRHSSN
jgi:hypothetical protein